MDYTFAGNSTMDDASGGQDYKTLSNVLLVIDLSLVVIGFIGNSLSFAVTVKTELRKLSTAVYLTVLAIADNFVLLVTLSFIMSSEYLFGVDIRDQHISLCWLTNYLPNWMTQLSAWCLVAVTMERTIAVLFPHK